jgi:hypothetical protein
LRFISLFILLTTSALAGVVPLTDNVLFAFEKCKSLSVDLQKGQLKEAPAPTFDLHCSRSKEVKTDFDCAYFDTGSDKKLSQETYSGGSELGVAELKDKTGKKLKFLIGKGFASYESGPEQKVCIGIFIFEQDALKQKASSPKSGL